MEARSRRTVPPPHPQGSVNVALSATALQQLLEAMPEWTGLGTPEGAALWPSPAPPCFRLPPCRFAATPLACPAVDCD